MMVEERDCIEFGLGKGEGSFVCLEDFILDYLVRSFRLEISIFECEFFSRVILRSGYFFF